MGGLSRTLITPDRAGIPTLQRSAVIVSERACSLAALVGLRSSGGHAKLLTGV